ncbi:MAG: hypothetical protein M3015_07745, partial [Bacteroidota bacterium]|nr:hypothetical protein [Bacteroidota bacterium]
MKKIVFSLLLTFFVSFLFAQDMKKAKSYLDAKQLDKAKTEIDGLVAKDPSNGEALYMKAKIYGQIADSEQYKSLITGDARAEALDAYKKAIADSTNTKVSLMAIQDQYKALFDLYSGYYSAGAKAFNDAAAAGSKEGYEDAMNLFIKANDVGQYIAQKKYATIGAVDTTLVLNIGKAALNAKNNDAAKKYFQMLADANIAGTAGDADNSGYVIPYQWLALHYKEAKDEANMMKYADLGKKLFPNSDYFTLVEMDYFREKKDQPALFKKYDELVGKYPDSLAYHFNYANDIFGYLYNSDEGTTINDKQALMKTLGEQVESAYKIDPADVNNNWLYAQYYYNLGIELRDSATKIKSTKPEDVKRKADINAESKANFNKAIPYADKSLATLEAGYKKSDKSRYKSINNLMQKIYQSLNMDAKVKTYQDKYDGA